MPTFRCRHPGSTTIMPSGKVLRFSGSAAGFGYLLTEDADEVKWLEALAKNPQTQIDKEEPADVGVVGQQQLHKPVDPAIEEAKRDAEANTAKAVDPNIEKLRNGLANLVVGTTGPKQTMEKFPM